MNIVAKFRDDRKIAMKGKGKVIIRARNGDHIIICDVFYVLGLESNLLSIGQFQEKRQIFHIEKGVCELKDDQHRLIGRMAMTKNRMFSLKINSDMLSCFSATVHDESSL